MRKTRVSKAQMQPVSQGKFQPKAVFTFFSLSGCGYCKIYKGEKKDKDGNLSIDPGSGWETLRNDQDLYNAGVEFVLYQVGDVKDPATGKMKRFQLEPEYKGIRGFPHLRLTRPDDRFNGTPFDGRISGWDAKQSYPVIKAWILQKMKEAPFKDYKVSSANQVQAQNPVSINAPTQSTGGRPEMGPSDKSGLPTRGQTVVRQNQGQSRLPEVPAVPPPNTSRTAHGGHQQRVQDIPKPGEFQTQEVSRPTATVFGLGTRKVQVIPDRQEPRTAEPKRVHRPVPKFLPSNYDQ